MANSNNKRSAGFISNSFGVAKKLSHTGVKVLNRIAQQGSASAQSQRGLHLQGQHANHQKNSFSTPQEMLRQHVPQISKQLLGRHYPRAQQITHLLAPEWSDQLSDYLFEQLNQISSRYSSVEQILDEAGAEQLEELTQDVQRSGRLSQALSEQNKWIAAVQGALSGATGALGSTVDVPASIALALRTIYQTGRAYGFPLNQTHEQEAVQYVFRHVNLGLVAEKQTVLLGMKALVGLLQRHDSQQLQQLLGSSHDAEALKKWLLQENGDFKWPWMQQVPKFTFIGKLTPVTGAGIGAFYSWQLIEEAHRKAQEVFSAARQYLTDHQDSPLSPLAAYEASVRLLAKATPLLSSAQGIEQQDNSPVIEPKELDAGSNPAIAKIEIQPKPAESAEDDQQAQGSDDPVEQGIQALAEQYVAPHAEVEPQKPAVPVPEPETDEVTDLAEEEKNPEGEKAQSSVGETPAASTSRTKSKKEKPAS